MASSSSSRDSAPYDVFLSHRGPDTKRSFSSWLKQQLEAQGISTFLDDKSLRPGDIAPREMDDAMQTAEWGVIVLSPGFFASGYCMKELKVFLDRERAILIGFGLGADDCNADQIVRRTGSVWEQHGGELWKSCSAGGGEWSEEAWRDVVRKAKQTTFLQLHTFDGYWDRCIAEAVRVTAQRLGRPVILGGAANKVKTTPFPRNNDFLGRDNELAQIGAALADKGRVCISGMGGVGKTQLALCYVYGHEREYGMVLWLDADSQSLQTSYLGLAEVLGVELKEEGPSSSGVVKTEEAAVAKIRDRLEKLGVPCLLVLDNVDNQSELASLLPRRGPCHIIATSRLRSLVNFGVVPLDVLGREDGLRLLSGGLVLSEEEMQCAEMLAERFGYLTLALAVSRRLFSEGQFSPSELLTRLDAKEARVFERELMDPVFRTHPDLIKLFQASVDMLERDTRATSGEKLLAERMLWAGGWFAPAPIATPLLACAASKLLASQAAAELIDSLWLSCWYGVPSAQEESAISQPRDEVGEDIVAALGLLRSYGLVLETLDGRGAFHKLVQSFGKSVGSAKAGIAMVQALIAVGEVERDEEHFANGVDRATPPDLGATPEIGLLREDGSALVVDIAAPLIKHYIYVKTQPQTALALEIRCETILTSLRMRGESEFFLLLYLKAEVLEVLGEFDKAEALFRQCLGIMDRYQGLLHHAIVSPALEALARLLSTRGEYDDAESYSRRSLGMAEAELGPENPTTMMAMKVLADLLRLGGSTTKQSICIGRHSADCRRR